MTDNRMEAVTDGQQDGGNGFDKRIEAIPDGRIMDEGNG